MSTRLGRTRGPLGLPRLRGEQRGHAGHALYALGDRDDRGRPSTRTGDGVVKRDAPGETSPRVAGRRHDVADERARCRAVRHVERRAGALGDRDLGPAWRGRLASVRELVPRRRPQPSRRGRPSARESAPSASQPPALPYELPTARAATVGAGWVGVLAVSVGVSGRRSGRCSGGCGRLGALGGDDRSAMADGVLSARDLDAAPASPSDQGATHGTMVPSVRSPTGRSRVRGRRRPDDRAWARQPARAPASNLKCGQPALERARRWLWRRYRRSRRACSQTRLWVSARAARRSAGGAPEFGEAGLRGAAGALRGCARRLGR